MYRAYHPAEYHHDRDRGHGGAVYRTVVRRGAHTRSADGVLAAGSDLAAGEEPYVSHSPAPKAAWPG